MKAQQTGLLVGFPAKSRLLWRPKFAVNELRSTNSGVINICFMWAERILETGIDNKDYCSDSIKINIILLGNWKKERGDGWILES